MNKHLLKYILILCSIVIIVSSCIRQLDLSVKSEQGLEAFFYTYPYYDEVQNVTTKIIIHINNNVNTDAISAQIPHLKYNKSWLFILTQDDCRQAAYSTTWAAIGWKVSSHEMWNVVEIIM